MRETKLGIWVGKFESSGSKEKVQIIPNTNSLRSLTVYDIVTACQSVKSTYNLTGDSHMMKNTEWGVVAYLADSKYGRNGTKISQNGSNYMTGAGNYASNTEQSTTGNIYGIYDINGTSYEADAGLLGSYIGKDSLKNFSLDKPQYYDAYSNYNESKKIKGDAMYETSIGIGSGGSCWYGNYTFWFQQNIYHCIFFRGYNYIPTPSASAFCFGANNGYYNNNADVSFRVVLVTL